MFWREQIARDRGIALTREYSEPEAAAFIRMDLTTLKRARREGRVKAVVKGERHIRYLGFQVVDMILFGFSGPEVKYEISKNPPPEMRAENKASAEQILQAARRILEKKVK